MKTIKIQFQKVVLITAHSLCLALEYRYDDIQKASIDKEPYIEGIKTVTLVCNHLDPTEVLGFIKNPTISFNSSVGKTENAFENVQAFMNFGKDKSMAIEAQSNEEVKEELPDFQRTTEDLGKLFGGIMTKLDSLQLLKALQESIQALEKQATQQEAQIKVLTDLLYGPQPVQAAGEEKQTEGLLNTVAEIKKEAMDEVAKEVKVFSEHSQIINQIEERCIHIESYLEGFKGLSDGEEEEIKGK